MDQFRPDGKTQALSVPSLLLVFHHLQLLTKNDLRRKLSGRKVNTAKTPTAKVFFLRRSVLTDKMSHGEMSHTDMSYKEKSFNRLHSRTMHISLTFKLLHSLELIPIRELNKHILHKEHSL